MKKIKKTTFDIIAIILIFLFVSWLFNSIKTGQEDFIERCMEKGYTEYYCTWKNRP